MSIETALRIIKKAKRNGIDKLDLSHLELTELPSKLFECTNLRSLDLSFNRLTELPLEIGNLTNLQIIHLNNNKLKKLPDTIGNITNLRSLYLHKNKLVSLPVAIWTLANLHNIRLYNNPNIKLTSSILNINKRFSLLIDYKQLSKLQKDIFTNLLGTICISDVNHIIPKSINDIEIGCKCYSLENWLENGVELAKAHEYTDTEIEDTKAILLKLKELFTH